MPLRVGDVSLPPVSSVADPSIYIEELRLRFVQ